MNILVIGGSRNIGYYAALRLLATLVKGDALIKADVHNAWAASARKVEGVVDALIFTVGAVSSQTKFSIARGAVISPPNLVTQALLNALATLPSPHIKIITITSTGLTRTSKASLPFPIRALYAYVVASPHRDKLCAERLISHVGGLEWNVDEYGEIAKDVLDKDGKWKEMEGLPGPGTVQDALIVRPATLTDGECLADKTVGTDRRPYRVSEGDFKSWTVSRKDVGHFVFDAVVNRWEELRCKRINVGY
ncbi:hypothetical protein H0H87_012786 [Tephrocybe sp. NHM501043]|nr:hypothetical protein H0H87_012786 [Tephrocybe sp. NHM501043]